MLSKVSQCGELTEGRCTNGNCWTNKGYTKLYKWTCTFFLTSDKKENLKANGRLLYEFFEGSTAMEFEKHKTDSVAWQDCKITLYIGKNTSTLPLFH